eukprot:TRINITY_DN2252_c0_g1_i1.p1 TRINITY_DN2252_c0_g1~~TRINITY_DN2252_c0_g1_i1.p1  ORF type:complete len:150 (-),score=27.74 TRINITY_DN2252_c0_g1_i1:48-497(-)
MACSDESQLEKPDHPETSEVYYQHVNCDLVLKDCTRSWITRSSLVGSSNDINQHLYSDIDVFIIVFDLTRNDTFEKLRDYRQNILQYQDGDDPVIAVIGNKSDLDREVDPNTAKEVAESVGVLYFEVSAKTGENLSHAFDSIVNYVREI